MMNSKERSNRGKPPPVYIDSNVFFYAKIMDRVYGRACSEILSKIAAGEMEASISALIPIEVANALRKFGLVAEVTPEIRAICSLDVEILQIEAADAREAAEIHGETKVSPYDCLHAALMRKSGLREIISADRDFDRLRWLKRVDPLALESSREGSRQRIP